MTPRSRSRSACPGHTALARRWTPTCSVASNTPHCSTCLLKSVKERTPMTNADRTPVKTRRAQVQTVIGCLVACDAPWLIEIIGRSGFDFATIDIEHEAFDEHAVVNLIRSADHAGPPSVVTTATPDALLR